MTQNSFSVFSLSCLSFEIKYLVFMRKLSFVRVFCFVCFRLLLFLKFVKQKKKSSRSLYSCTFKRKFHCFRSNLDRAEHKNNYFMGKPLLHWKWGRFECFIVVTVQLLVKIIDDQISATTGRSSICEMSNTIPIFAFHHEKS